MANALQRPPPLLRYDHTQAPLVAASVGAVPKPGFFAKLRSAYRTSFRSMLAGNPAETLSWSSEFILYTEPDKHLFATARPLGYRVLHIARPF